VKKNICHECLLQEDESPTRKTCVWVLKNSIICDYMSHKNSLKVIMYD
jgi:hypothetical protein